MENKPTSRKHQESRENPPVAQTDLRRIKRACAKMEAALAERDAAIRDAYAAGETYRDIAEWANMSHQRVAQIVKQQQQ